MKLSNCSLVTAIFLTAILAGPATAAAAQGKELYTSSCLKCHGASGEGKGAIAKMLKVTMRNLSSKEVQAKSDAELTKVITAGQGKMKPVTGLSEAKAADDVAYLRTLKP